MAAEPITLSSLTYVPPQELAQQITDPNSASKVAVIDVRDSDFIGGHVKGCVNTPMNELDARMPELLRTLKDKERVVFHCMLSQQRGPKAALMYARAKSEQEAKEAKELWYGQKEETEEEKFELTDQLKGLTEAENTVLKRRVEEFDRSTSEEDKKRIVEQMPGPLKENITKNGQDPLTYHFQTVVREELRKKQESQSAKGMNVTRIGAQEICVLEGGFGAWQSRYGDDKDLTEGYVKDIWEGMWG